MGYNQLSIVFAVCRNDVPWRFPGARRIETFLIRRHVLIPEFLGLDRITSNLGTGICKKCQKLPLDDIKKRFQMASIFAAEFWKKMPRRSN